MRSPRFRIIGLVSVVALLAAFAVALALAAEGDGDQVDPVAVSDADQVLLDRLVALHEDLPGLIPADADFAANLLDPVLLGSFTTARSTLDRLEDDVRGLFVDGDAAGTAVGDAVAEVARGLLVERQALLVLERGDGSTNPRPLDASNARNAEGIAIDADGLLGLETTGIDLLLQARSTQRAGYDVLVTVEDVDPAILNRQVALVAYEERVTPTLWLLTSEPGDELLVPVDRYDAPVGVARATSVTYACVDRAAYLSLTDLPDAERIAAATLAEPTPSCSDIARRAGLSLADQQALVEGLATSDGGS